MTGTDGAARAAPHRHVVLSLEGYGVAFGGRVVLASIDLEVPARGVLVLVGPGGVGKSTLLRTLCGANNGNPSLRTWGNATFAGAPLGSGVLPSLVAQNAKLLIGTVLENVLSGIADRASLTAVEQRRVAVATLERGGIAGAEGLLASPAIDLPVGLQRRLAIVRTAAASPRLMCVDEPTAGLSDEDASALLELLRAEGARRAVIFVTHNQRHARAVGGLTALLAGGRIHEIAPTEELFTAPLSRAAREFARTGGCSVPSPGTAQADLAEGVTAVRLPPAARSAVSASAGPRSFRWVKQGALGGCARPGIVDELDHDIQALRRVGVTVLVTLEAERLPEDAVAAAGIRSLFFPIEDMRSPSIAAALEHCRTVERLVAAGEVVALHCRAGLGRTGTMLAAQLIYEGKTAVSAIDHARRIEPRWIESAEQVDFLERFAAAIRARDEHTSGPTGPETPQ